MISLHKKTAENEELLLSLQELGKYLNELRVNRGRSLAQVAMQVGSNAAYLSEIERGKMLPNDNLIRALARYYGLDENKLFEMVGRVPLVVREEVETSTLLQRTLKEIAVSTLNSEKKQELYQRFYRMFKDFEIQALQ